MRCLMHSTIWAAFLAAALALAGPAGAERTTVLRQIDVPHNYYFREMYLPQLTSGPSALAWSPDGGELVYSMQGSLWRQPLDSGVAVELTAGPGYDYQPDWSPDGKRIVFSRYYEDAVELMLLDLASGETRRLTEGGAVNLEPRWSPDGKRLAFVSTRDTGRFHVFIGEFSGETLSATQLVPERESAVERYYYSRYDHELSPTWLPDGRAVLYVSNRDVPYGTGNLWLHPLDGGEPRLVRREETSWRARPDVAPDGKRIAYASYLGRQWHQLWVDRIDGVAEPFPLTYGRFDVMAPRWSPDGTRLAYVSNESGNTAIRVQEFVGGRTIDLAVLQRDYKRPMQPVSITVLDEAGRPVPARVAVLASDGRAYGPPDAWLHADHEFDRDVSRAETVYFHSTGSASLQLPPGQATITVWHGPEHGIIERRVDVRAERENAFEFELRPLDLPAEWRGWQSGDVHVHMNYGGTYRNTPEHLALQARAEDLDAVFNLVVNKEQRVPDIDYFSGEPDAASATGPLILHQQEFHTSFWGHLGLLGLDSHLLVPDYSAYPYTAAASLYPDNVTVAELAREQGALVGYVHPFDAPAPDPAAPGRLSNQLPVNAALDLVDYYEVVGFADHRTSAAVWYRLLNCGVRIAAAGGTDAMANYASLRGPVGMNRTYVRSGAGGEPPAARRDAWLQALGSGASIATNGPLLGLTVNGAGPGGDLELGADAGPLRVQGFLRSAVPVEHLELVHNGEVVERFETGRDGRSADIDIGVDAPEGSGWFLLRAWNEGPTPLILDQYPYATTSPVYVSIGGQALRSPADGAYFLAWIDRVREAAAAHEDYNSESERASVLAHADAARTFFEACRGPTTD